jgi:hypothetical protein
VALAETGFDCSGFVRATYEQAMGLMLPRRAEEQAAAAHKIDKTELQPGDLVFFNTLRRAYSHVGIYLGEGKFIHSPRSGARVRVESMDQSYWKKRFNGARRVLDDKAAAGTDTAAAPMMLRSSSVLARDTPAPSAVRLGGTGSADSEPARPRTPSRADDGRHLKHGGGAATPTQPVLPPPKVRGPQGPSFWLRRRRWKINRPGHPGPETAPR